MLPSRDSLHCTHLLYENIYPHFHAPVAALQSTDNTNMVEIIRNMIELVGKPMTCLFPTKKMLG